jgi:rSAM/selenodomain-associated transferase 2
MPAPISVVIPTLNAADRVGPTLGALTEGLDAGLIRELVISDGGSTDAIAEIADLAGARLVIGAASRGGQLARGADATRGAWLLVLHADTVLAPGWARAVTVHLQNDPDRAACFHLRFNASGVRPRLVAGWANLRTRMLGLPYGDQGLLIPRALYQSVGGYVDVPLMEDVLIARALKGRITLLPHYAVTDVARYRREGWFRRGARNLWTLARFLTGTPPDRLVRRYEGRTTDTP